MSTTTAHSIMFSLITQLMSMTTDVDPLPVHQQPSEEYLTQMYCLSLNTYFETRGESFESKIAVAQSVMHRVHDTEGEFRRHDDICGIVKRAHRDNNGEPLLFQCWYSWYCDGKSNEVQLYHADGSLNVIERQAWHESIIASFYAYHDLHEDLVDGSTHYYNDRLADPFWADRYEYVTRVGEHVFLK